MTILTKTKSLISGMVLGLCFAPVFFLPGIFAISVLVAQVKLSSSKMQVLKLGYCFGFGFYLSTLYWISFGVSVYIEEFWWAIPFALFGLPAFIAIFTAQMALLAWCFRNNSHFYFLFCCCWLFIELIVSRIFTGLPWGVVGYALSNWLTLLQFGSIVGVFGLSFVVVYIGGSFYHLFCNKVGQKKNKIERVNFLIRLIVSIILLVTITIYGKIRLDNNPTEFTNISARIVQPSIPQTEKWDPEEFWQNLDLHIRLSKESAADNFIPDLIVWSEAALTASYHIKPVKEAVLESFASDSQILLTGAVTECTGVHESAGALKFDDENPERTTVRESARIPKFDEANLELSEIYTADSSEVARKTSGECPERTTVREDARIPKFDEANLELSKVYSSLIGFDKHGFKILEYHKSHLVPFGEYMPLKSFLPLKKITHGLVDYSEGIRKSVFINRFNLTIWPLICYESIFPYEVITSNKNVDLIVNITNDAWYGNSSGPYQHFEISRMRAIENGLPMIRAANNGISGFIDPVGRVVRRTELNDVTVLDGYIPKKLSYETIFSRYGIFTLIVILCLIWLLQLTIRSFFLVSD